jgi:hypothetical protein
MALTHAAEERVTFAVTSLNNRRGVASGVFCGAASRRYDSTDYSSENESSAVEYSGAVRVGW